MDRLLVGCALSLALFPGPAFAGLVEIPLPGLIGVYAGDRTVSLQLPAAPDVIHGASFRITGTGEVGELWCFNPDTGNYDLPTVWQINVLAYVHESGNHLLHWGVETLLSASGAFIFEATCTPFLPGQTWDFLLDGEGSVTLFGGGALYSPDLCDPMSDPPSLTVTEAVLIVDAEFPLAVQPSTWGKIKALYR